MQLTVPQAAYLATERRRATRAGAQSCVRSMAQRRRGSAGTVDSVHGFIVVRNSREDRRLLSDSIATFSTLVSRARLIHPDVASSVGDPLYIRLLATFFHPTIVPDRTARNCVAGRAAQCFDLEARRAGRQIVGANEVSDASKTKAPRAPRCRRRSRRRARAVESSAPFCSTSFSSRCSD